MRTTLITTINAALLLCASMAPVTQAATIVVASTADSGPGSLRAALVSAANGDTIDVSGIAGTILLTGGELLVNRSVTILGPGPSRLAVDGNAASRVFHISSNSVVRLSGLTMTNGYDAASGGAGILNDNATVTVSNCVLSGNSTLYGGGGVANAGGSAVMQVVSSTLSSNSAAAGGGIGNFAGATLEIMASTLSQNSGGGDNGNGGGAIANFSASLRILGSTLSSNSARAAFGGGGILNAGGLLTISNSTLSANSAGGPGGAIQNANAQLAIDRSTLSGNSAGTSGGALFNTGSGGTSGAQIHDSTLSGNSAQQGGGVYNYNSEVDVLNSTLSGNLASFGSGIFNVASGARVEIGGSILKAGAAGENIVNYFGSPGTITSLGYNLSSDNGGGFLTAAGDQVNTDPLLGPLQDNGGATFTHALLCGSPAIDKGRNYTGAVTDQRGAGFARSFDDPAIPNAPGGDGTDIGAFERQRPCNSPPVARCKDVIVSAGAGCTANASIDDGSFDPDGEAITLSQSPPGPYPPGTNLVTLTATDSRNTSDSCSARVIVRDTTPPQITCPRDITVEFTDANGTTVSFAPSASDDCSGPPAIVCLPASGSTFPIGITAVACTATDRAGNSAGCAFWVTVLGARGVKQHVLAELTALRAGLPHSGAPASQELDAAIRSLAASLAPRFWVDETHLNQLCGGLAMTEEAMAVGEMQELLRSKHNPVPAEALMGLSGRIVRSDRLLAVVAVRDATATGLGPEPLRRAGAELAKGDAAALAGRYAEAIEHYHAAWTWAQRPRSLAGRDKD